MHEIMKNFYDHVLYNTYIYVCMCVCVCVCIYKCTHQVPPWWLMVKNLPAMQETQV